MLVSLFRIVRRSEGRACAWLAATLLMTVSTFRRESVSVFIGLPALALAVAALHQALAGADDHKNWRFWFAGVLYALSLQTKLFTGILFPSLILATLMNACPSVELLTWAFPTKKATILIAGTIITFLLIAVSTNEPVLTQLISPH